MTCTQPPDEAPPPPPPAHLHCSVPGTLPGGSMVRTLIHRDYTLGMHTHDFVEVNLVLAGRGWHYLSEHAFPLEPGHAFVIPPGIAHAYRDEGGLDVAHLLLHPRFLDAHRLRLHALPGFVLLFSVEPFLRAEAGLRHALVLDDEQREFFAALLHRIDCESQTDDADGADEGLLDALALAAVSLLARWSGARELTGTTGSDDWRCVQCALDRIHADATPAPTVAELAAESGLSERAFTHLFTRATGETPKAYLTAHRVHAAARLLEETDLSVTEIGLRAGFYDTPHFSRTFSRLMGMSPLRFRKRH